MLHYCAFQLDWSGHIVGRIDLSCADDEDAKTQARQFLHHCDIEVWILDRRVAVLKSEEQPQ
jgi:hypothetical protein